MESVESTKLDDDDDDDDDIWKTWMRFLAAIRYHGFEIYIHWIVPEWKWKRRKLVIYSDHKLSVFYLNHSYGNK